MEYLPLENVPITFLESQVGSIGPADNFMVLDAILLSTQSKGNMTITSADILDQPVISPNWLLNGNVDLEQAIAAFKRVREIAANCDIIEAEIFPGPSVNTTDAIVSFLRENMTHLFHGTSTCKYKHLAGSVFTEHWKRVGKMGTSNDTSAVVDSRARVRGVTGLRVVDASAFPLSPPGHPMSSLCELFPSYSGFSSNTNSLAQICLPRRLPSRFLKGIDHFVIGVPGGNSYRMATATCNTLETKL